MKLDNEANWPIVTFSLTAYLLIYDKNDSMHIKAYLFWENVTLTQHLKKVSQKGKRLRWCSDVLHPLTTYPSNTYIKHIQ